MESGNRAAGHGDETERKEFAGHDRTGTVDELADGGEFQSRQDQEHTECERENGAQLHKRAQVIARGEEQPDRENAGRKAVEDDGPGEIDVFERKERRQIRVAVNVLAAPHRQQQQHNAHG